VKYTLNPESAKKANDGGKRITQPGEYTGKFAQAWYQKNEKGTEGVFLTFEADTGQVANLRLYTHNGSGEELPSYKTFNAVLAVLRLKGVESKKGKVTVFDGSDDVEQDADVFPDLVGKKIGILLQTEEYHNKNGEVKTQANLFAPFCPDKRATAAEVLNKKVDGGLDKLIEYFDTVSHKPIKGSKGPADSARPPSSKKVSSEFAEDDIPF